MKLSAEETTRLMNEGKTDWDRLRREKASGIEPDRDIDEGEFDWSLTQTEVPRPKRAISVCLEADVLEFFRSQRRGAVTRPA